VKLVSLLAYWSTRDRLVFKVEPALDQEMLPILRTLFKEKGLPEPALQADEEALDDSGYLVLQAPLPAGKRAWDEVKEILDALPAKLAEKEHMFGEVSKDANIPVEREKT
jgi:hypothetical protein